MLSIHCKTIKGNQWFVSDESVEGFKEIIYSILTRNKGKVIQYTIEEASEEDIERYGGICESDVMEYVIENACLLSSEDEAER
jgi:hypothetical protein